MTDSFYISDKIGMPRIRWEWTVTDDEIIGAATRFLARNFSLPPLHKLLHSLSKAPQLEDFINIAKQ